MHKTSLFITGIVAISLGIGFWLLQADRYPGAKKSEGDVQVSEDFDPLDSKVEEALRLLQSGDVPPMQAIGMIREVLEENPDHYAALLSMGLMSLQTGQYDKAVERFEKLLTIDDENPRVLDAAADAYLGTGDTAKALEQYQKMIVLDLDPEVRDELKKRMTSLEKTH
jgi:outer membrane protein